jgi:hypothetical protein
MQSDLNDIDTNESSLVLIYKHTEHTIYTQNGGLMPVVIKNGKDTNIYGSFTRKSDFALRQQVY